MYTTANLDIYDYDILSGNDLRPRIVVPHSPSTKVPLGNYIDTWLRHISTLKPPGLMNALQVPSDDDILTQYPFFE